MSTKTAVQAHQEVQSFAHTKAKQAVRRITADMMPIGKAIRQGDIYVKRIKPISAATLKSDYVEFKDNQLAPGNTQGSRHIVTGDVKLYKAKNADQFTGPVAFSEKGFAIQHPEHAHFEMFGGGACFQVTYQQDYATQQRVRD